MRAIIIHGWGGSPLINWMPWLAKELRAKGFDVIAPQMPNTEAPEIQHWVEALSKTVEESEEETVLIGHSIGCQTIIRYLASSEKKVKGVLFVAGWFTLKDIHDPQETEIAKPWVETPIEIDKFKQNAGKVISIFSDDDPYVNEENWKRFEEFGNIIVLDKKGHIDDPQPEILESALELLK